MLVLNLSPHVKSLGRELLHYFDSKKNSSPNSKVLSISSSITFFKTILGTYNELDFVNKKNIAIKKLEDILKTPDVMAKCRLMFCVIELLFSMTEGINMTSHFDLYFLIICLIKSFFSQTCCSQMGLVQLFCFKQLGLHDLDKISNVCSFDVKNILLETLPIQFESKLVVGEYISAVKQAQDLIAFNESAIYSIKTQILKAFNYGSWHSIEQMIEAKYQFMMSYKAILAKRTLQYYNIFINTSHATVRKTNFSLHRAEDIIFASIYSLNNMPIFYIHQDKYTLKDFSLPYLVDNSDDFLLNQCQSPMRKYTSEVEDICNKHKLFIIKLKTILIKNSKELVNMLEKALTKSDLTKYMIQRTNEFQQLSLEYDCIPQLPYNYDFIFVDIPMQASLWKKYGFISLLAEFYNEIISIQEDETDSLYSMEFIASCNQLQHLSNKVTQTNSLEGYLEIFYASTILFEVFYNIITHECNTLKLFNFSSIFEPNHFNKYLFEKIKYIHSSLLSITQCLMFCIPHIEKQETTISIKEKYLDFLLDFIDPIHFGNVIKELKNQYSEHIKNIIRNFSISLNATKIR
ncbi:hypothetical protein HZS_6963 [Henneguya salminicola]|nr:hypothetical protein HZS_6963 [Henneguya salminicola]